MSSIQLIVGLGNPGAEYNGTRHNAGEQFVRTLAAIKNATLNNEKKYHGLTGKFTHAGRDVRLLIPTTYMNLSGKSVSALASFYHITPDEILVAHDELDMPPGVARLKQGGGHGGHNGLRDIIPSLGNRADFTRLRIGIGHPGQARDVSDYVLGRAPAAERELVESAINHALAVLPQILDGDFANAMNILHAER